MMTVGWADFTPSVKSRALRAYADKQTYSLSAYTETPVKDVGAVLQCVLVILLCSCRMVC